MTNPFLALVAGHPYLFANIISFFICVGAAFVLRSHGRLIRLGGLLIAPGF